MGLATSKDLYIRGLKKLLAARGSRVSQKQLGKFLDFIKKVCPWFPKEGTVSLKTWQKIGEQLQDFYTAHGPRQVPIETFGLWTLIRDCLDLKHEGCKLKKVKLAGHKKKGDTKVLGGILRASKKSVNQEPSNGSWDNLDPQDQANLEDAAAKYDRKKYPPVVAVAQKKVPASGALLSLSEQVKKIQRQLIELKLVNKKHKSRDSQVPCKNPFFNPSAPPPEEPGRWDPPLQPPVWDLPAQPPPGYVKPGSDSLELKSPLQMACEKTQRQKKDTGPFEVLPVFDRVDKKTGHRIRQWKPFQ